MRCAYLLENNSGHIRLQAFDDISGRLEYYDNQMDDGQRCFEKTIYIKKETKKDKTP